MSARTLEELAQHVGHSIECVRYGPPDDPASVTIECDSCGEVLIDLEPGQFLATEDLLAADAVLRMIAALRDVAEYLDLKAEGFAREYPPDHCINLTVNRQRANVRAALAAAGVRS